MEPDLDFVLRQIPVNRDVGEQKTHRHRRPCKRKAGLFSNCAVRTLTTDDKLRRDGFRLSWVAPHDGQYSIRFVFETDQLATPLDGMTTRFQRSLENFLSLALWNNQEAWLAGVASRQAERLADCDGQQLLRARMKINGANIAEPSRLEFRCHSEDR